jgi:hypothetical protein
MKTKYISALSFLIFFALTLITHRFSDTASNPNVQFLFSFIHMCASIVGSALLVLTAILYTKDL